MGLHGPFKNAVLTFSPLPAHAHRMHVLLNFNPVLGFDQVHTLRRQLTVSFSSYWDPMLIESLGDNPSFALGFFLFAYAPGELLS